VYVLCVDAGRSSVKVKGSEGFEDKFLSILSTVDYKFISSFQWVKNSRFVKYGNYYYVVGDQASRYSANPVYVNNDELFIGNIKFFVIESIIRLWEHLGGDERYLELKLALDLTYNNMYMKEQVKAVLKSIKKIKVKKKDGEHVINIDISGMFFFYQGWAGLMDYILDESGKFNGRDDILKGNGIVIDVGRSTTDITHVRKLTPAEGESVEFGTVNIYHGVQKMIHDDMNLNKSLFDIEEAISENRTFRTLRGKTVDMRKYMRKSVELRTDEFRQIILERIGNKTSDFVLFMGGGGSIFFEKLKKEFQIVELSPEPIYANVRGMWKFLNKIKFKSV